MYQVIKNLPIDYDFSTKTKIELKLYGEWFKENKDIRINHLIEVVKETEGFNNWKADFTEASLNQLGKWLLENVIVEKISSEEYAIKREKTPDYIEIPDWDLSIKTRSILVDVGFYFGEVFIHTYQKLKWYQCFSKINNDINNGHMIIKLKIKDINPVWLMYILGLGLADKTKNENSLHDLYKAWVKYV